MNGLQAKEAMTKFATRMADCLTTEKIGEMLAETMVLAALEASPDLNGEDCLDMLLVGMMRGFQTEVSRQLGKKLNMTLRNDVGGSVLLRI